MAGAAELEGRKNQLLLAWPHNLLGVVMTTAQIEIRQIKRELAESGADPFEIAAVALQQARLYRELLNRHQRQFPGCLANL